MSDTLNYVFARSIRAERSRLGISQTELARRLNMSQSTIAAMEAGTRPVYAHELVDLCRALGVTLRVLLVRAADDDLEALGL